MFMEICHQKIKQLKIKNKDKWCGIYSFLGSLHSPKNDPFTVKNYTGYHKALRTDGTDLTDGLIVDDIEKT